MLLETGGSDAFPQYIICGRPSSGRGAFVTLFVMGQAVNPSPYEVVIVVSEVGPGASLTLDLAGVDLQSVAPRVAREHALRDGLDEWLGAMVVEPLHPGQPLMHAHLVRAENPAAVRRLALGLEDAEAGISAHEASHARRRLT